MSQFIYLYYCCCCKYTIGNPNNINSIIASACWIIHSVNMHFFFNFNCDFCMRTKLTHNPHTEFSNYSLQYFWWINLYIIYKSNDMQYVTRHEWLMIENGAEAAIQFLFSLFDFDMVIDESCEMTLCRRIDDSMRWMDGIWCNVMMCDEVILVILYN